MENNEKQLVEVAMLAGEILLVSGAEIFRIEETIHYILSGFGRDAESIVFSTGIFITVKGEDARSDTLVKRVVERSTNLHRIYLVNMVSRRLCDGSLTIAEAYKKLEEIKQARQYSLIGKEVSYISVALFFCVLLQGSFLECICAGLVGGILGVVVELAKYFRLNDFCINVLGASAAGIMALIINNYIFLQINSDLLIISAIMSLVPGVAFTTAVRDILNGDYSAGVARMMEAVVTAFAVAVGVGVGIALFTRLV
ncbi:threonine/serine exporter family protein [Konateibacter massiliensis]|uniref:threonine/serine exporter family protein n=1 Tax=Konateibacter massiliensis TaxID=2002841 RepID=UPI000C15935B|nr:threonine/serine exporter family protein [Konateibacter massiliensis]